MAASQSSTFGFLLLPGFTALAFAAAVEPLRLANYVAERELYHWVLLSKDGAPVRSSAGFAVSVDHGLEAAPDLRLVTVCGGLEGHRFDDRQIVAWLRRAASRGAVIGSLCLGSHLLARAGLLDGHACTTHWENMSAMAETYPAVMVKDQLFTVDRNRFTCAGGTAATDMMLYRIAADHGDKLAMQVAEEMLHDQVRKGTTPQQRTRAANTIERRELSIAIRIMQEHIEEPLDLSALSAQAGQSRRNIERLFKKYLAVSPARYYLDLRLRRARQLLWQTQMSVTEVAISSGFVSATHFSKCYRDRYGVSPRVDQSSRHQPFVLPKDESQATLPR
ncbi:transcriptional regulator, AraC family with amidase-like domain [Arboricoccus pini]|uniref:Transcriptional regulator, AraC family with amidase-like domain n=1 Tax=Arboricoccus pini TaxID=1963835 RepID=A0A212PVJ5_9PROT|nr:GlxA family transcriptional regulator [Arboricoccus pini]SNB50981.1 transcriptional regulator, AraC family with amidase-like domain [Arboricoccus pini]